MQNEALQQPGGLVGTIAGDRAPAGGLQGLVQLPIPRQQLVAAEQAVLAMGLEGGLQHGRLGKALAPNQVHPQSLGEGLALGAVPRLGQHPGADGHGIKGAQALWQQGGIGGRRR